MPSIKVTACTADHIGDRSEQQDRVAILTSPRHPNSLLAVVSDGMGGRTGGRMAADQVISTVTHLYRDLTEKDAGSLAALLKMMADEAHTVIRLTALSSEKEPHATFVALIVRRDFAIWAHAGDSRLYHFRGGRLMHRTQDHTYASYLRAAGQVQQAIEAERRFNHLLVSALGLTRPPELVIGQAHDLQPDDAFLLCSDGLWAHFSDMEFGELLLRQSPREASSELVQQARQRAQGSGDNLSLAIVKLERHSAR
jgi:serine/threonine protein phosphatase PrpC